MKFISNAKYLDVTEKLESQACELQRRQCCIDEEQEKLQQLLSKAGYESIGRTK